jgi:pimeloyl-ACP methyl ester carboxylesterase
VTSTGAAPLTFRSGGSPASNELAGSFYDGPGPLAVLLHGSGPADRAATEPWIAAAREIGLAVLAYDKPGCGQSSGSWREQSFEARCTEALDAVAAARRLPGTRGKPVALLGGSQGAWIALLAAAQPPEEAERRVDAVVAVSAAGVSVAEQELFRVRSQLPAEGVSAAETCEAVAFLTRRVSRLAAGDSHDDVFADERPFDDRSWRPWIGDTDRESFDVDARVYAFDPRPVLPSIRCPVLAVWGGQDVLVPVAPSVEALASGLRNADPRTALVVVPRADHGLRVTRAGSGRRFAPGAWDLIGSWLRAAT